MKKPKRVRVRKLMPGTLRARTSPKDAGPPPQVIGTMAPNTGSGYALAPSPWHRMDEGDLPPVGEMVLFFLRGRIRPGFMVFDMVGRQQYAAIGLPAPLGETGQVPHHEFTHWRLIPAERPR